MSNKIDFKKVKLMRRKMFFDTEHPVKHEIYTVKTKKPVFRRFKMFRGCENKTG